ncbi:hypothetical protein [Aquabacterium sp.]|uniref:hypothetical protein n=1 Tax=Aquabacterium sp. TaxID=1872578 RepID=UPI0035B053CF
MSEPASKSKRRITWPVVLAAVKDLRAAEQQASRDVLAKALDVPMTTIDDHITTLLNQNLIYRVTPGVFELVTPMPPARAQSLTLLPDGYAKWEIGDSELLLTPRELRMAAKLFSGHGRDYEQIQVGQELAALRSQAEQSAKEGRRREAELESLVLLAAGRVNVGEPA